MKRKILFSLLVALSLVACSRPESETAQPSQICEGTVEKKNYGVPDATLDDSGNIPEFSSDNSAYINNQTLAQNLSTEQIETYISTAESSVTTILGNNYQDILNDQQGFIEQIEQTYQDTQYITTGNNETLTVKQYADMLMALYIDNKIQLECSFTTDSSQIYEKNYTYFMDGIVELTAIDGNFTPYNQEFHTALEKGDTIQYAVRIRFIPGNSERVLGIDIM